MDSFSEVKGGSTSSFGWDTESAINNRIVGENPKLALPATALWGNDFITEARSAMNEKKKLGKEVEFLEKKLESMEACYELDGDIKGIKENIKSLKDKINAININFLKVCSCSSLISFSLPSIAHSVLRNFWLNERWDGYESEAVESLDREAQKIWDEIEWSLLNLESGVKKEQGEAVAIYKELDEQDGLLEKEWQNLYDFSHSHSATFDEVTKCEERIASLKKGIEVIEGRIYNKMSNVRSLVQDSYAPLVEKRKILYSCTVPCNRVNDARLKALEEAVEEEIKRNVEIATNVGRNINIIKYGYHGDKVETEGNLCDDSGAEKSIVDLSKQYVALKGDMRYNNGLKDAISLKIEFAKDLSKLSVGSVFPEARSKVDYNEKTRK
ncbi:MAG: hypothetical protein LBB18_01550 [Puniceicoccales bacterium]|nr:hypothetical protein [Puniceicoccales bacterium]